MGNQLQKLVVVVSCLFFLTYIFISPSFRNDMDKLNALKPIPKSKAIGLSSTQYPKKNSSFTTPGQSCLLLTHDITWKCLQHGACKKKDDFITGFISYTKNKKKIPIYLHQTEDDVHISRVLFNGGAWEKGLLNKIESVMSQAPNSTFIDIGAHIGVYSVTMASLGYKTIAIDCFRGNIERICASASFDRKLVNKLQIVHNAVSDKHGVVGVKRTSGHNVGGNFIEKVKATNPVPKDYIEYAQAILLDDLLEQFDIKSAVVKMDVQGHEHKVLKGAETFFTNVDVLYVQMEFNFHRSAPSGVYIRDFMTRHKFIPLLPPSVTISNFTEWPLDVLWVKRGI